MARCAWRRSDLRGARVKADKRARFGAGAIPDLHPHARSIFPFAGPHGRGQRRRDHSGAHMPFLTNTTVRRIEWGECDPAGIVFYPRFFAMFDNATTLLFSAALGMTKYQFLNKYDCAGYPMVDTRARFLVPARFGDDVTIETAITEIKRSSFQVLHHLKKDG